MITEVDSDIEEETGKSESTLALKILEKFTSTRR